jgi:hypothetical protein
MELKNYATGLGWDAAKGAVDCPQDWWDEHLAVSTISVDILSIV